MNPVVYNANITLVDNQRRPLADNEWYVLMVTSARESQYYNPDTRIFFDERKRWLGLECTSTPERIYISKNYNDRDNRLRGETLIAAIKQPELCYILGAYRANQ
jgi:hypothetical protein